MSFAGVNGALRVKNLKWVFYFGNLIEVVIHNWYFIRIPKYHNNPN